MVMGGITSSERTFPQASNVIRHFDLNYNQYSKYEALMSESDQFYYNAYRVERNKRFIFILGKFKVWEIDFLENLSVRAIGPGYVSTQTS